MKETAMNVIQSSKLKPEAKNKKSHPHIDMTPMVDVAMLLLAFFMLTAVFSKPQVIELNLPKNPQDTIPMQELKILNLFVDEHSLLYKSRGLQKVMQPVDFSQLHNELLTMKKVVPGLITRIKLDRQARYERLVDILDELNSASVDRFAIVPLTKEEQAQLNEQPRIKGGNHN
jgi:biopolymer transport protein ExbD